MSAQLAWVAMAAALQTGGGEVRVLEAERGPDDPGPHPYRLRLTLQYMEEGRTLPRSKDFWTELEFETSDGHYRVSSDEIYRAWTDEGAPAPWRILVLLDSSRSMLAVDAERGRRPGVPRYVEALDALRDHFVGRLGGFDFELAIEPFDCTVPWANGDAGEPRSRWFDDRDAARARIAELSERYRRMKRVSASRDHVGMCTALYQAIDEGERALDLRARARPGYASLLVVVGDGGNDLSDGPGRVWTAGYPERPFGAGEFLVSPEELAGTMPHRPRDLLSLYDRIVDEGAAGSREEARVRLSKAYENFLARLKGRSRSRWLVAVGPQARMPFDAELAEAMGSRPLRARGSDALEGAFGALASALHDTVRVNISTPATEPAQLNELEWSFRWRGASLGRFRPQRLVALATDPPSRCLGWEPYCSRRNSGLGSALRAALLVWTVLAGIWILVPRWLFREDER